VSTPCVYVLHSEKLNLVKIGNASTSVDKRVRDLRKSGYGGAKDWRLMKAVAIDYNKPYKAEKLSLSLLTEIGYHKVVMYVPTGSPTIKFQPALELFTCTVEQAIRTVTAMANKTNL
jgi:acetylornithine/succinyldiaminopimelate/putrescine aminotransferase